MKPGDDLYLKAREILRGNPELGKKRLAMMLGVKTPTSRRLQERYRGEVQGHNSSNPVYERVRKLKVEQPDWGAVRVAQELGMSLDHAKLHLARWTGAQTYEAAAQAPPPQSAQQPTPSLEAPNAGSTLQDAVGPDTRDLCYRGAQIHTLEDLLVYAQVDDSQWEVERWVANKWEIGARNPATGEILTSPLFQIKVWLRRKVLQQTLKDLMRGLLAEFKKEAPPRPPIVRSGCNGEGMLEVSLMDVHFGKLCWGPECGRDYNPEIAERMFMTALEDLIAKAAGLKPGRILFPCGNDFLNTDILGRTTTSGTPQDSAVVWKEGFVRGKSLLVRAIDRLRAVAPVDVVLVNGNHDCQSIFYLGEALAGRFYHYTDVTVDNAPTQRKYVVHGKNLLAFTHGDREKFVNLPLLMASERPREWALCTASKEWHLGHYHSKKCLRILPAHDAGGGVLVRVVPSLCPPDSWHSSMGYSGKLAAEAYYWDPEAGVVATFTHHPL
jgi:hypothetical protein